MTRRTTLTGLTVLLLGCGGGGGSAVVTRDSEAGLNVDALILAARDVEGTLLPLSAARSLDGRLREARTTFPVLQSSHAALDFDPHSLHITVALDAPWRSAWDAGTWRTGVSPLDDSLAPLKPTAVAKLYESGTQAVYSLTFDAWMRSKAAAFTLYDKSPKIVSASVVPRIGGDPSDDLLYSVDPNTNVPAFSTGGKIYRKVGAGWTEASSVDDSESR